MDAQNKIDLSPIMHKLASSAFELFRNWTAQLAGRQEIVIKDEGVLVADLQEAFEKAIRNLRKKDVSLEPIGYDLGLLVGFVNGWLNSRWYNAYVVRASEEYKRFAALKAIEGYLGFDTVTRIRIDKLYTHFLTEDTNLEQVTEEVILKDIDTSPGGKLDIIQTDETGKVLVLVKNLIIEQIFRIAKMEDGNMEVDLMQVFSWEEIEELVRVNGRGG